ncbi:BTB/POZ domain-containing protein 6-B-like [Sitodiplosis mosellana]|uniref:BTB/POZ domain-containing protein 6-B-like n=1 Tax=Sitodiplosis mosellana TaxID=263140 RepID=UPI0024440BB9|nr:BTB/POZ domain-containing protein 6-B-like [Sitodiplosis mosellana]
MFNGTWKEKDEVEIADSYAAAFKEFLQFFYFGQVQLTTENVSKVMYLGEKYNVAECLVVCSKFVKNNLNDDNVCRNYGLATLFNQEDLKRSCETVIGLNTNAVLNSIDFLSCDPKVLAKILRLNWLSCTEVELFEACMSWVKTATEKNDLTKELVQAQLGDSLYNIRFGSMSFEEFGTLVPTYGQLFTTTEYVDIIQMITNKEFQSNKFNQNREKRCDSDSPGFMYEIRLEQNPPENCAIGVLLKSKVEIMDFITIQFYDDPLIPDDISPTGLIYQLDFCQIEKL